MINDLFIEDASFSQGNFNVDVTYYCTYVPYEMTEARVKVEMAEGADSVVKSENARYEIGEDGYYHVPLEVGNNYFTIRAALDGEHDTVQITVNRQKSSETLNKEMYRPQYHHTPEIFLANDPNGLVYNAKTGEYHLYYQYASGLVKNNETKVWAHAVSTDLVHWEERPVAIYMDDFGEAYSGSCVVDIYNTSGLFDDSVNPEERLVIIYTSYTGYMGDKSNGSQSQSIAYTTDGGNTWVKYSGNPVIPNPGDMYDQGFRDPKVLWLEDSSYKNGGIWVMIVGGGPGRLFTSENLIDWKYESTIYDENGKAIVVECPDIFKITTDQGEEKWVYIGSLYNNADSRIVYSVGTLGFVDGTLCFTTEESHLDSSINGNCAVYSMQTFYNTEDGRRVAISWIRDWVSFNDAENGNIKDWLGTHTLATSIGLTKKDGQYILYETPVDELKSLREKTALYSESKKSGISGNILSGTVTDIPSSMYEISALIKPETASSFGFVLCRGENEKTVVSYDVSSGMISLDRTLSGATISEGGSVISVKSEPDENGNILLHIYVDVSIIDIFGNTGTKAINTQIYPSDGSDGIEFFTEGGTVYVESMEIYKLKSIFEEDRDTSEGSDDVESKSASSGKMSIGALIGIMMAFLAAGVGAGLLIVRKKK